ncbi:MAG: RidA family protein [Sneathiellaceae bacterium]
MVNQVRNPRAVAGPDGMFSHGIEVPPGARWLFVTGQVGIDVDGRIASDIAEQCRVAWTNVLTVLADADMGVADLVRVNAYLTDRRHIEPYRVARDALLKPPYPASTVLVVADLALPEFLVEIEAVAAAV